MPTKPDIQFPRPPWRAIAWLTTPVLMTAVLLGCSTSARNDAAKAALQPVPAPAPPPAVEVKPPPPVAPIVQMPSVGESTLRMMAYAERIRQMPPPELTQEIARLNEQKTPADQLQLSVALSQLRQLPELIRAQELLARVLASPEAEALHPLARLLASRFVEQRRLEEQLDRQNAVVRETQRKLDQTTERLEALKAIERSLVSRQPASAPLPTPPAPRSRPAP